jgi:hypothetical protein
MKTDITQQFSVKFLSIKLHENLSSDEWTDRVHLIGRTAGLYLKGV